MRKPAAAAFALAAATPKFQGANGTITGHFRRQVVIIPPPLHVLLLARTLQCRADVEQVQPLQAAGIIGEVVVSHACLQQVQPLQAVVFSNQ